MSLTDPLRGIISAVATPLSADLSPDLPRLIRHCRWLLDHGCDALGVFGTTGEANAFSVAERMAVLDGLVAGGIPADRLLPGTGCCALPDTVALTRHAVGLGAPGVLMLPPFYYKNLTEDGLFAAFAGAVEGTGDDRLRVYLYHFPQLSGVPLPISLVSRLAEAFPGVVVGAKDSSGSLENMVAMVGTAPGFAVFSGGDENLLPLLRRGGAGCITAVSNLACFLARDVRDAWLAGDEAEAERHHEVLAKVRAILSARPLFGAIKAGLARYSGDEAWNRLRPPLVPLDPGQAATMFAELDAVGFRPPGMGRN